MGKYLVWELKNSDIKINCILDRRANEIKRFETKEVYTLDEFLKRNIDTDVIVVTALSAYNNILYTMAEKKIEVPVMNLGDIVFEL